MGIRPGGAWRGEKDSTLDCAVQRNLHINSTMVFRGSCIALAYLLAVSCAEAARSSASNPELRADAIMPIRTHSLFAPYVDSTLQNNYWDYGGDAIIDTNRYVMLTQDRRNETGWLWSRLPIEANDFEITSEFVMKGKSTTTGGDGFAMWLTTTRAQPGPVFGSMNRWNGLGIIFDTFPNQPHRGFFPRISVVENDGTKTYNTDSDGEKQDLAQCAMQLRHTPAETRLRFTYVKDVYMELAIQNQEWNQWNKCFRIPPVNLPGPPYLGFSASTGEVTDTHSIVSVWTNKIVYNSRTPADLDKEREQAFADDKSSHWWAIHQKKEARRAHEHGLISYMLIRFFISLAWLIKWLVILALVAVGSFVGYEVYKRKVQSAYKNRRMMA